MGKIREEVFDGIEGFLDGDELETFEKICDIRIDKIILRDLVMSISILTASLGIIVSILFEAGVVPKEGVSPMLRWFFTTGWGWLGIKIVLALIPIAVLLLALFIGHYWTQVHARYAIKEEYFIRNAKREEKATDKAERD